MASLSCLIMTFFAQKINRFVGDVNIVYLAIFLDGLRLLLFSLIV